MALFRPLYVTGAGAGFCPPLRYFVQAMPQKPLPKAIDVSTGEVSPTLEDHFARFRENTIGADATIATPYGRKPLIYCDWIASGRLYRPIEAKLAEVIGPYMANTHTESSTTGRTMTAAYREARSVIKRHVGAHPEDVLVAAHSGMTGVVNKMQRILGLRAHERHRAVLRETVPEALLPVVFLTHMEHHSNQTSWLECLVEVVVIPPGEDGLPSLSALDGLFVEYAARPLKIVAATSCSNVTGVVTDYHEIARVAHRHGGLCFVDFAASAPYLDIDIRPAGDPAAWLDAIFFSPHKFLGGPGSSGVLIFSPRLYTNRIPDNPGGGTVDWTNPWGEHKYLDGIEAREDGGTPAILQTIKSALAMRLKEEMGTAAMHDREQELLGSVWRRLDGIPNLHLLAPRLRERIGAISFYIDDLHYNLGVRLLNDRFGIQVRGGCHCAGTYGHYLLNVDKRRSKSITDRISSGDTSAKPGWIRLSVHPTMTDAECRYVLNAIEALALHHPTWAKAYRYSPRDNDFEHHEERLHTDLVASWFRAV